MTGKSLFRKYRFDISLEEGRGAGLICWLAGLMVFFMALSMAVTFSVSALSNTWVSALTGKITIEIPPPADDAATAEFRDAVGASLAAARRIPEIAEAVVLSDDEVRSLVQPWLGTQLDNTVPLPGLIDITLIDGADPSEVHKKLSAAIPSGARIDLHDDTMSGLRTMAGTIKAFFFLLTATIVILSAAAVGAMVRSKLAIHKDEVETLHLLGATDAYISRQFRQHTLKGTLKGAIAGTGLTILALFAVTAYTKTLDSTFWPQVQFMPLQWLALVLTPMIIACIVSHLTAQRTALSVIRSLA
jgi:cell division transport system permease protein